MLLPVLFLSACVTQTPPHAFLPDAARDKIASTETVLPIKQSEIYVFVPASQIAQRGGGGLLLALIDSGVDSVRTSKAETAVKPLRDSLIDYNFDQTIQSDVQAALAQDAWLHAGGAHVVKEVTNENLDVVLAQSKNDAVLFTVVDYRLSNDAGQLIVSMNASLFANSDALRALKPATDAKLKTALGNSLYRNRFTVQADSPVPGADRDQAVAAWSANHGQAIRAALAQAASRLSSMLAADIAKTQADSVSPTGTVVKTENADGSISIGYVISQDAGGGTVLYKDGTLAYLPNSQIGH
jgi:hypothetical protein